MEKTTCNGAHRIDYYARLIIGDPGTELPEMVVNILAYLMENELIDNGLIGFGTGPNPD